MCFKGSSTTFVVVCPHSQMKANFQGTDFYVDILFQQCFPWTNPPNFERCHKMVPIFGQVGLKQQCHPGHFVLMGWRESNTDFKSNTLRSGLRGIKVCSQVLLFLLIFTVFLQSLRRCFIICLKCVSPPLGVGNSKCPNETSPNYWGCNLKQIFDGDVQNPQKRTLTNPWPH